MTTTSAASHARRLVLLALMALELVLLYLLTGDILFQLTMNQGSGPVGTFSLVQWLLVGLPSIIVFIAPSAIGALARTWQGAITLAVAPWWLVLILHADILLHATAAYRFQTSWFGLDNVAFLLASLGLFGALGFLGWLARHSVPEEL